MSEDLPFGSRGGVGDPHYFPVDGEYVVKIRAADATSTTTFAASASRTQLDVRLDGARVKRFTIGGEAHGEPPPASYAGSMLGDARWEAYAHDADAELEVAVPGQGRHAHVVGVSFVRRAACEPEGVAAAAPDRHAASRPTSGSTAIRPSTASRSSGPFDAAGAGDTPSRRRIFVCRPAAASQDEEPAPGRSSRRWRAAPTAGRSTDADVETLLAFYEPGRGERRLRGRHRDGARAAARQPGVPVPHRARSGRTSPPGTPYRISDLELASRLSFFLWSSIPDDELLDLAARGQAEGSGGARAAGAAMLADPRVDGARRQLRRPVAAICANVRDADARSAICSPSSTTTCARRSQRETELFFDSQLREDRSVVELLTRQLHVRQRAAGAALRHSERLRQPLPAGDAAPTTARGGLLGQGSILTVTSYPNRTSPVLRGKWMLENMLGAPPPPPPPNVPALKDNGADGRPASMRERMEQHRTNPVVRELPRADGSAGLRARELRRDRRVAHAPTTATPIDASGALPDGTTVRRAGRAARASCSASASSSSRTVTEKLLTYALGRGVEYYDMPAVRADPARRGGRRLPLVVDHSRHRQEHAVSDAGDRGES